jgi:HAE1 family hydrophobic/amphiphilic exporter-1
MVISDFAIKRPIVTVTVMLALVVFGLVAMLKLHTDEFPDVQPPFVQTAVVYPGASPDVVEREVTDPIEEAISGISGVKSLRSQSMDGFAFILTEFHFSKELAEATQEIRDKISATSRPRWRNRSCRSSATPTFRSCPSSSPRTSSTGRSSRGWWIR